MTTITLKMPEQLDRRLQKLARQRHTSRSAILREAAEHYVNDLRAQPESCLDLVSDLIGRVDGPEDLSYDKKRLQGFGE